MPRVFDVCSCRCRCQGETWERTCFYSSHDPAKLKRGVADTPHIVNPPSCQEEVALQFMVDMKCQGCVTAVRTSLKGSEGAEPSPFRPLAPHLAG